MEAEAAWNELEARLRAPDSIMEPGVLELVKDYLKAGGKPAAAIEDLSEAYEGYAQMCDVLCQWLEIADVRVDAGGRPAASGGTIPDEFTLLQELAKERFEPAKFLGVFRRGHPDWLNELISDRRGRQLIYSLSTSHRNSLLLNYAIQRILKQGHEDEVSLIGGSLAAYCEVYHRLLAGRLVAAAKATTPAALTALAAEIADSCVGSQHTYVHAQQLLMTAARWPGGAVFRRLSQEAEAAAVAQQGGPRVYQLMPLFVSLSASEAERQAVQLVSDVLARSSPALPGAALTSMPSAGAGPFQAVLGQLAAVEGRLVQLLDLYQQQQHNGELPVEPLRHPALLQLLLSGMFAADRKQHHDTGPASHAAANRGGLQEVCIQLLAISVAGRPQQQQAAHQQDGDARGRSASPLPQLDRSTEAVAALLRQALLLAAKVSTTKLREGELDTAAEVCKQPIAAVGLLQYSRQLLGDEALYGEDKMALMLPNHLTLLHKVACEQPGLIPQVLSVLRCVLTLLGNNRQELTQAVLKILVSLVVSGAAELAMQTAVDWSKSADPSLLRIFVQLVLESVEPPYSNEFARSMIAIMHKCLIGRLKYHLGSLCQAFAAACENMLLLSDQDSHLLSELKRIS